VNELQVYPATGHRSTPKTMSCQSEKWRPWIDIAQLKQLYIEMGTDAGAGSMGRNQVRPICCEHEGQSDCFCLESAAEKTQVTHP